MFSAPIRDALNIPLQREVNQELWNYIMEENCNGERYFENDTFMVRPYSWDENDTNDYHFFHKPSGLKIAWYKYPLRGAYSNLPITPEQFRAVLYDCTNSIHPQVTTEIEKWWKG